MSGPSPAGGPVALSFSTPRLRAEPATAGSANALQEVLDAAPAWGRLAEAPRGPGAGADLLADAEADPERRLLLLWPCGAGRRGPAAGLLDLQLHWPEPRAAHVRLLVLRESLQGRGLGREAAEALEVALRREGFLALRLSVTDENEGAARFWERLGFAPVGRLDDGVTVYERRL
jgi:ribosomal protein S18 acetylase RimI-like enzyme